MDPFLRIELFLLGTEVYYEKLSAIMKFLHREFPARRLAPPSSIVGPAPIIEETGEVTDLGRIAGRTEWAILLSQNTAWHQI